MSRSALPLSSLAAFGAERPASRTQRSLPVATLRESPRQARHAEPQTLLLALLDGRSQRVGGLRGAIESFPPPHFPLNGSWRPSCTPRGARKLGKMKPPRGQMLCLNPRLLFWGGRGKLGVCFSLEATSFGVRTDSLMSAEVEKLHLPGRAEFAWASVVSKRPG